METANVNKKMLDLITQMSFRLERIETEVKEIRDEIGLEVRPEYIKKLQKIQNQKGRIFDSREKLLSYLKNEIGD